MQRPIDWLLDFYQKAEGLFFKEADARVYAILRILYALVCLINMIHLWTVAPELMTDAGLISSATFAKKNGAFSILYYISDPFGVSCLFVLALIALLMMLVGFQTKVAVILVFIWQFSYAARLVGASGWDYLLLNIGFSLMISPLDRVWSVRAWRARQRGEPLPTTAPQYGLLLIQLEIVMMYVQTLWHKVGDPYWRNGELASYFFLGTYSFMQKPLLLDLPRVSVFFSHLTLLLETLAPAFLCFARTRLWGFVCGYTLHFAIFFSEIPIFSLVCMMAYWAFVSGDDLDRLGAWLVRRGLPVERFFIKH